MAKIDVIVPCYNYGRYLSTSITSVLTQSVHDLRLLIINDASPDNTLEVAQKFAETDPRVSVISHRQNQGLNYSRNEGITWACADYLLILDADDVLSCGAFERAIAILDVNPDIAFVYGKCIEFNDRILPLIPKEPCPYRWVRQQGIDFIQAMCMSGFNYIETPTTIVRTSVQKLIGGYRCHLPHTADMEMWLRLAAHGAVAGIQTPQAFKRAHLSNMSSSFFANRWADFQQRKMAFDSFFTDYGERLPDARHLQTQAHRVLAEDAFWTAIGLLCRGQGSDGRKLLHFAFELQPRLRYWPPFMRLSQVPDLPKKVISALGIQLAALIGRPG